jgi:RNA polymerase sigma-70 factor (ECF subfamily)
LQEHSYEEIAQILEIPIGTVMSRLSRGKQKLQQALRDYEARNKRKIIPLRDPQGGQAHG